MSGAGNWEQLARGVRLPIPPSVVVPELHEIDLPVPRSPAIGDIEVAVKKAVTVAYAQSGVAGRTVAVGA
ncbi:MAG: hypothetical protein ACKO3L_03960, partial [Actinomycetota bacterium]